MGSKKLSLGWSLIMLLLRLSTLVLVTAEDPYQYEDWTVTYINAAPLGVMQQVIAINGQFPGPQLDTVTNYNLVINVRNQLDEPFLLTWDGIQQRKNVWQDGVAVTNCPIQPGQNWTYHFKPKDQIGSFYYFPSLLMQKAAGGFGSIRVNPRSVIPSPFAPPADDFFVLIGDWYKTDHKTLRSILDEGYLLGTPDGVLINGQGPFGTTFTVDQGNTYRLRISNVGSMQTLNFRIQGHRLLLVETEGSYVVQTFYDSLDVHAGQSYSVMVTVDQSVPADFYMVANSRFADPVLYGVAVLHYSTSMTPVSGDLPPGPTNVDYSFEQARSIKGNLTAGAARLNPQGSFHYGQIKLNKTYMFANSAPIFDGRPRFAVNGVSFVEADTPLKLADYFELEGVFTVGSIPETPSDSNGPSLATAVLAGDYRAFIEMVFQNSENTLQSWHMDGYAFWVVGMGPGSWGPEVRFGYNLVDAAARTTTQVYANAWTAVLLELDNPGFWNIRSQELQRQWLGQEFYMRVYNPSKSSKGQELPPPNNLLLCGKAIQEQH